MRYFRMILLHLQHEFEFRARMTVYFLMSLINPLVLIMFWQGAYRTNSNINEGWMINDINSYYLLLIVVGGLLIPHVEESVALFDIKEGRMVNYLLRPFSYYYHKLMEETTYRSIRGLFGIVTFFILLFIFGASLSYTTDPVRLMLGSVVWALAYLIAFNFKMIIGLIAFWIEDVWGIFEISDVILIVFAGNVMPLDLFPAWLKNIAFILPFSHIVYFPILTVQGKLSPPELINIITTGLFWVIALGFFYKIMWAAGVKKYTGVGQ